jgi:tRNA (guanine-N7-)-methyltransferase
LSTHGHSNRTQRSKLDGHPLFERVSEEELEQDVAAGLLAQATEEGQKVARNGGSTWRNVYRRLQEPRALAANPEQLGAAPGPRVHVV